MPHTARLIFAQCYWASAHRIPQFPQTVTYISGPPSNNRLVGGPLMSVTVNMYVFSTKLCCPDNLPFCLTAQYISSCEINKVSSQLTQLLWLTRSNWVGRDQ